MIISASRRTDIPAFHMNWFLDRLSEGFVDVKNPYNPNQIRHVSLSDEDVDCIVFWSKDPSSILSHLDEIGRYKCGFQYTINAYGPDIEPFVPDLEKRMETFLRLAEIFSPQCMTWRYDPIILSKHTDVGFHLEAFEKISSKLKGSTNRVIISFVDHYRRIDRFWKEYGLREPTEYEIETIATHFVSIASECGMTVSSCAENLPLAKYGIKPGACIDAEWISSITGRSFKKTPARSQRSLCRCIDSADIGSYGTCGHGCRYCYASR